MANFIDNESYLKEKAKRIELEDQLKDSINEIQRLNKDVERLRRLNTSFGDCYILKHLIGHGAYGNVYEAIRIIDNYRVAVKVVERKALDPKDEEDLLREVEILQSISHPNIVKIYDFFVTTDKYYLVLELAQKGDLFDQITNMHPYHEKDIRDIIYVIMKAIKFCHDKNIVHRDLKPENILIASETITDIKLADFGFATRLRSAEDKELHDRCGTTFYMSPELFHPSPHYGSEVDLWAIGVITYIMCSGRPPFDQNSIRKGQFRFNHNDTWINKISNEGKAFVLSLLSFDVNTRLTATAALQHPWLKKDVVSDRQLSVHSLDMSDLKQFNATRRFKKAANAILWSNRIKSNISSAKQKKLSEVIAELDNIDERKARLMLQKTELEDWLSAKENVQLTLTKSEVDDDDGHVYDDVNV